jgi:HK97 family phage major capsid protein
MEIKDQISELKSHIDAQIEKASEEAKSAAGVADSTKSAIESLTEKFNSIAGITQDDYDRLVTDVKKLRENGGEFKNSKSLAQRLMDDASFKSFASRNANTTGKMMVKAVGDMTEGGSLTNGSNVSFVEPTRLDRIVPVKREEFNIRSLFSVIPMSGSIFAFPQETGGEGAPTAVAEGNGKPQSDNDFTMQEAPARKIAHFKRISDELLNDVPALAGFLQTYGVIELLKVEDAQLLSGNGSAPNLTGLASGALTDANFVGSVFEDKYALNGSNKFDALTAVNGLLGSNKHMANAIVINPADFYDMLGDKGSDGQYLYNQLTYEGSLPYFSGVPIYKSTSVAQGTLYMGDTTAGQIAQREGVSVRLYDQDADNATENKVTVVIEERLAFPIYYPTAWFVDTFANIKLAIEAAS